MLFHNEDIIKKENLIYIYKYKDIKWEKITAQGIGWFRIYSHVNW